MSNDFENRFSRLARDHYGEKLKALPDEKRAQVIDALRERFRQYENDPEVKNEKQVVSFFQKWEAATDRLKSHRLKDYRCGSRLEKGSGF